MGHAYTGIAFHGHEGDESETKVPRFTVDTGFAISRRNFLGHEALSVLAGTPKTIDRAWKEEQSQLIINTAFYHSVIVVVVVVIHRFDLQPSKSRGLVIIGDKVRIRESRKVVAPKHANF